MTERSYFIRIRGKVMGPFGMEQLRSLRDRGQFRGFHEFSEDRRTWQPATALTELFSSGSVAAANAAFTAAPPAPVTLAQDDAWFYVDAAGNKQGPRSETELGLLLRSGAVTGQTLVWKEGLPEWVPFSHRTTNVSVEREPVASGKSRTLWVVGIGTAVAGLAAAAVVAVLMLKPGEKPAARGTDGGSQRAPVGQAIASPTDEKGIASAVGLVVCGVRIVFEDGSQADEAFNTGSCFAISPDGYLITNKHVVEKIHNLKRADLFLKKLREEKLWKVEPTVWVFFGREKHVAELLHVSDDFDFSLLKVDRRQGPYFRLASADTWPRGKKVAACGFPGAAQIALSSEEKLVAGSRAALKTRVDGYFKPRDFEYVMTDGSVSRVVNEDGSTRRWIQHNAVINGGNSGGPLLDDSGVVVGINTQGAVGVGVQGIFYSLTMPQLKREIDKYVSTAVWN